MLQHQPNRALRIHGLVDLQAAAGRYARAPHPMAILKNHGADLTGPQITALLDEWEAARETRATGYLNDVVDYDTFGWNASIAAVTAAPTVPGASARQSMPACSMHACRPPNQMSAVMLPGFTINTR
jgi:hypothetical protein